MTYPPPQEPFPGSNPHPPPSGWTVQPPPASGWQPAGPPIGSAGPPPSGQQHRATRSPGSRPPQQRRSGIRVGAYIAAGIGILIIGIGIGATAKPPATNAAAGPTPTVTVTDNTTTQVTVTPAAVVKPGPATSIPANASGIYAVGTQIKRGVWSTTGAVGGSGGNCYSATLSSFNTDDIIDNNNTTGPDTIDIGAGVKAFQVDGCNAWTRISG